MNDDLDLTATPALENRIFFVRGQKVMLDSDLAEIYAVSTKRLNEQVKRNARRFPIDFVFRLTHAEHENLRSQNATSSRTYGGRRYLPFVFTEHGAVMLASVLNSAVAVRASVFVVRAFVKLREVLAAHKELALRLNELETRVQGHDDSLNAVIAAIRDLMEPLQARRGRRIGFRAPKGSRIPKSAGAAGGK
jgi:hypothetical protein